MGWSTIEKLLQNAAELVNTGSTSDWRFGTNLVEANHYQAILDDRLDSMMEKAGVDDNDILYEARGYAQEARISPGSPDKKFMDDVRMSKHPPTGDAFYEHAQGWSNAITYDASKMALQIVRDAPDMATRQEGLADLKKTLAHASENKRGDIERHGKFMGDSNETIIFGNALEVVQKIEKQYASTGLSPDTSDEVLNNIAEQHTIKDSFTRDEMKAIYDNVAEGIIPEDPGLKATVEGYKTNMNAAGVPLKTPGQQSNLAPTNPQATASVNQAGLGLSPGISPG